MIDALLFAVRDGVRAARFGYGVPECDIMDDGHPPPRVGNIFVAVYERGSRSTARRNLDEKFDFGLTLTMRVSGPVDRVGNTLLANKLARTSGIGKRWHPWIAGPTRCSEARVRVSCAAAPGLPAQHRPPGAHQH